MAIPNKQLETWSHQGAITGSATTYKTIKNVLEAPDTPFADKKFSVFLQGSYGNNTNIYAESDVDIVIELESCFYHNKTSLPSDDQTAFETAYQGKVEYDLGSFKADVLEAVIDEFGDDATEGTKAIRVDANGNRRKADIIVAASYHHYYKFKSATNESHIEGICFFNSSGERIPNFPKQHRENLTARHQASKTMVKPLIRIMKNLRSKLIEDDLLGEGIAPSYFIEGLIYNAPLDCFTGNYDDMLLKILNWLFETKDRSNWECANGHYYLLREKTPNCWPAADCEQFVSAAIKLWNEWK